MLVNKNFSHIQFTVSKERRGKSDDYAVLRRRNKVKNGATIRELDVTLRSLLLTQLLYLGRAGLTYSLTVRTRDKRDAHSPACYNITVT